MAEEKADPIAYQRLNYRRPPEPIIIEESREEIQWRRWRIAYRIGLFVLLSLLAFYVFPNLIIFGRLTRLSPEDFVGDARPCIPIVRAIKQYQQDTGQLPNELKDLAPKYLPTAPGSSQGWNGRYFLDYSLKMNEMLLYDFTPGTEGWQVKGGYVSGPIPLPPVRLDNGRPEP